MEGGEGPEKGRRLLIQSGPIARLEALYCASSKNESRVEAHANVMRQMKEVVTVSSLKGRSWWCRMNVAAVKKQ